MLDLTKIPYCIDCGSSERKVYWGGGPRCQTCSDKFSAKVEQDKKAKYARARDALDAHISYRHQNDECPDDGIYCSSCCPHEEHDHGVCNDCGEDISGDLAGEAEALFEGDR